MSIPEFELYMHLKIHLSSMGILFHSCLIAPSLGPNQVKLSPSRGHHLVQRQSAGVHRRLPCQTSVLSSKLQIYCGCSSWVDDSHVFFGVGQYLGHFHLFIYSIHPLSRRVFGHGGFPRSRFSRFWCCRLIRSPHEKTRPPNVKYLPRPRKWIDSVQNQRCLGGISYSCG